MAEFAGGGGSLTDLITAIQTAGSNTSQNFVNLIAALDALFLTRSVATFTLGAAATTVVANTNVTSTSIPLLIPLNAAAATLMGSAKALYVSARTAGTSFTVATANATAAAGTESFAYVLVVPT